MSTYVVPPSLRKKLDAQPAKPDLAQHRATVRTALVHGLTRLMRGCLRADTSAEMRELTEIVRRFAEDPKGFEGPRDVDEQIVVARTAYLGNVAISRDFGHVWLAAGGFVYAAEIAARIEEVFADQKDTQKRSTIEVLGQSMSESWTGHIERGYREQQIGMWAIEGVFLADRDSTDAERAKARKILAPQIAKVGMGTRAALAALLHDAELAREVAVAAVTSAKNPSDTSVYRWAGLITATLRDGDALEAFLERFAKECSYTLSDILLPTIERVPADALARACMKLIAFAEANKWTAGRIKEIATVAACIDDDVFAAWLARNAHVKNLVALAADYFARVPNQRRALEEAARTKGKHVEAVKSLLDSLGRHAAAAPTKAAPADKKTRAPQKPDKSSGQDKPKGSKGEDKKAGQDTGLPDVLVRPPWAEKNTSNRPVLALTVPMGPYRYTPGDVGMGEWAPPEDPSKFETETIAPTKRKVPLRSAYDIAKRLQALTNEALLAVFLSDGPNWIFRPPTSYVPSYLEALVVRLGEPALPLAIAHAIKETEEHLAFLLRTVSPETVLALAPFVQKSVYSPLIRGYLIEHADLAASVLLVATFSADGDDALEALRALDAGGKREVIMAAARAHGEACAAATTSLLAGDPPLQSPRALPKWLNVGALPPPVLTSGEALPESAVRVLIELLSVAPLGPTHPALARVRAACTPDSLDAFAWALFSDWLLAGAKGREDFALYAIGHIGSVTLARKLESESRNWAKQKSVELMQKALDALALVGTDLTLTMVHERGLASKFADTALRARSLLVEIASQRGVAYEILEDDLVPELGLGGGPLVFDYGPRQFELKLNESLGPYLVDASNTRFEELPKPGKKDDAVKAKAAKARFDLLADDLARVGKLQIHRLEHAMRTGRVWSAPAFRALCKQPLLRHVAPRIVWSSNTTLFRVAEDGTFADSADAQFSLPNEAEVTIAHPISANEKSLSAMGRVFLDYKILQPFSQLGREVRKLDKSQGAAARADTCDGKKAPFDAITNLLSHGWRRTPPQEGTVKTLVFPLDTCGMPGARAELQMTPGLYIGPVVGRPEQTLGALTLSSGTKSPLTFGALPPILATELLRDYVTLCP